MGQNKMLVLRREKDGSKERGLPGSVLSSLEERKEGSMDCVIRSFPFNRSSPYRVGGSSRLYCAQR
jgi:hypothetical protein